MKKKTIAALQEPHPTAFRGLYLEAFQRAVTMDTAQSQAIIREGIFDCWKARSGQKPTLDNPYTYGDREWLWVNKWQSNETDRHKARLEYLAAHQPEDTRQMLVRFLAVAMTEEAHDANKKYIGEAHHLTGELLTHPWRELRLPAYGLERGYFHLQQATLAYGGKSPKTLTETVLAVGTEKHNGVLADFRAARDRYAPIWAKLTTKVMEARFTRAEALETSVK